MVTPGHAEAADRLEFPVWVDDFWSGSRAAITREMAGAAPEAAVDWFLHPILLHPVPFALCPVMLAPVGGMCR